MSSCKEKNIPFGTCTIVLENVDMDDIVMYNDGGNTVIEVLDGRLKCQKE